MPAVGAGVITLVVTADTGPGQQMTAQTIPNVREIKFRFADGAMDVYVEDPPKLLQLQYSNLSAISFVVATKTMTITDA